MIKTRESNTVNSLEQLTCLNQFHDILPGSSIAEVYAESREQYDQIERLAGDARDAAQMAIVVVARRERVRRRTQERLGRVDESVMVFRKKTRISVLPSRDSGRGLVSIFSASLMMVFEALSPMCSRSVVIISSS